METVLSKTNNNCNKRYSNIVAIISVVICILLFAWKSSPYSILLYGVVAIISLLTTNQYVPFILIGASNYLPAVYHISPLVFCTILLIILLFKQLIVSKKLVLVRFPISYPILLLLITIYSCVTGIINKDLSFFEDLITILVFVFVLYLLMSNSLFETKLILRHFIIGLGCGIILTVLIKAGFEGFISTQPDRLAIGERADPNSTALLFAIFCTYIFIRFYDSLRSKHQISIGYGMLLVLGIVCLFMTQSRGAALCFVLVMIVYILNHAKNLFHVQ